MPETAPRVQIVIPVRGAHEALRLCLACVDAHTPDGRVRMVCPRDELADVVATWPRSDVPFRATPTDGPRTFAQNCNIGASPGNAPPEFRSEFLVLLNSDAFVGPGWLDALLAPFADPDVVAVGPMGTNVSGHQCVTGIPRMPSAADNAADVADIIARARIRSADWNEIKTAPYPARRLVGFCLAVRRSAWDAVRGFDEQFENAFCDDDLALRLNLLPMGASWGKCIVVPCLLVLHAGSASFAELPDAEDNYRRTLAENEARFRAKWGGQLGALNAWFDGRGVR